MLRFMRFAVAFVVVLVAVAISGVSAERGQRSGPQRGRAVMLLSGTYELESTRGDNAQRAADEATRDLPRMQRDRAYQDFLRRLQRHA